MNGSRPIKLHIVEAKSDVPEARKLQTQPRARASTSSVCTTRLLQIIGNTCLATLTMTEKGVYAISNMSTLSMGAYDRYRLDANNRVRTDGN